ncbi:MAG: helix-turn-helix domain-containing protein [Sphingomicrobium sp.]
MPVQFIEINGAAMAVIPADEYEALSGSAEDRDDLLAAEAAERRRSAGEEYIPVAVVDRLLDGENPLRVWREYRNLKLKQLAAMVGCGTSNLSELERGRKDGSIALWRKLAAVLDVSLDDLLDTEEAAESREPALT